MQNIRLENLLLIDIETVSEKATFAGLTQEWQVLWQEKVQRQLPEGISAAEFYPQRAGVMAEFAKVICISLGHFKKEGNEYQLRIKSFYGHDEKILLQDFIAALQKMEMNNNKWSFTGHNIKEFDIPFICRRLLINGLQVPPFLDFQNMKPWETNMIDTFQYWRFGDYKHYTSLKLLAAALNIPSPKDDIDGSMVGEVYWSSIRVNNDSGLKRIVTYCQKDVATTGNIIMRFKNLPILSASQIIIVK
ncbi:MAG: ribonuclease H-like domain-containing protein [Ferruginibacter sp.]|nr:ribonuclease H-like domain-containing protein [Bacteroidota bacterium]MBX2919081.1 ribonuclease H-like domain-containing protein [Ferruginibacter sp.]MCC7377988.1 ribonuclease H-like domain-containing protein [Chitinophagaceae bacterium]